MPYGQFQFDITDVSVGGSTVVQLSLPDGETADGYYKFDPVTGDPYDFSFDGTTGAVIDGNDITLHFVDGGRGDADGVANGVIVDPGGPVTIGDTMFIGCQSTSQWEIEQFGGADGGEGTVKNSGSAIKFTEGSFFLTQASRTFSIPAGVSTLAFEYEASFDPDATSRINDAFEVALLDQNGYSLVPTIGGVMTDGQISHYQSRDAFFNVTETVGETFGSLVTFTDNGGPAPGGLVQLDVSHLRVGQQVTVVARMINNDDHGIPEDRSSWVKLACSNQPPVAVDDTVDVDQNTTVTISAASLLANDFDTDGHSLFIKSVTQPAHGTLVPITFDSTNLYIESLEYTPDLNYPQPDATGADSFTYEVTDHPFEFADSALTATGTVAITVHSDVNHPPTATHNIITASQNQFVFGNAISDDNFFGVDSDLDGDPLVVTQINGDPALVATIVPGRDQSDQPLGFFYVASSGGFLFNPQGGFDHLADGELGSARFDYTISDARGGASSAMVYVIATGVNDNPVANDDSYTVTAGTSLAIATPGVLTNDSDIDDDLADLRVILDQGPANAASFSLNPDGSFSYTPAYGFSGTDSFSYQVDDGHSENNLSNIATVTITVNPAHGFCYPTLDFERAADGSPNFQEMIVFDQWSEWGVTITVAPPSGDTSYPDRKLMLFDSSNPPDNLTAFGTPNMAHGGPGEGTGGATEQGKNDIPRGLAMMIDRGENQALKFTPKGGIVTFDFDSPATIGRIGLLDISHYPRSSEPGVYNRVIAYNGDTILQSINVEEKGTNSYQSVPINATGVTRLVVDIRESAAISELQFCLDASAKFHVVDGVDHSVYSYDEVGFHVTDGSSDGDWDVPATGNLRGAAANAAGTRLWTVSANHQVQVHDLNTRAMVSEWTALQTDGTTPIAGTAQGVTTDGTDLWIVNDNDDRIYHFPGGASDSLSGGVAAGSSYSLPSSNQKPTGITTDGTRLFVVNDGGATEKVFVYSLTGIYQGYWTLNLSADGPNHKIEGITTDPTGGTNLWVVDRETDKVYEYPLGTTYGHSGYSGNLAYATAFPLAAENDDAYGIADPPGYKHWTADGGGNWNDPANWEGGSVPTSSDAVWIDINGDHEIIIDSPAEAESVISYETINLSGGSLTVVNTVTLGPISGLAGVGLKGHGTIDGNLINNRTIEIDDSIGSISILGAFTQQPKGDLSYKLNSVPTGSASSPFHVADRVALLQGGLSVEISADTEIGDSFVLIRNDHARGFDGNFKGILDDSILSNTVISVDDPDFRLHYDGGDGNDVVIIHDGPLLWIDSVRKLESQSGVSEFVFTVSLDRAPHPNEPVSVNFRTEDVTTSAFSDYTPPDSVTLNFDAENLSRKITVQVTGDISPEANEQFKVVLENPINAGILTGTGIGTIIDDDGGSESLDNLGTDFWVTFPHDNNATTDRILYLTSTTDTSGTVTVPGLDNWTQSFAVTANQISTIALPAEVELVGVDDASTNQGVHVTSAEEIAVFGLSKSIETSDGFLALPTDALGTEYVVTSWRNFINHPQSSELAIVATEDNTVVAITPSEMLGNPGTGGLRNMNETYTITMNKGQTYQLYADSDFTNDLTGSIVSSNLPIAVFAGHRCALVPSNVTACDHLVEQLPPVDTWGTSFLTVPLYGRPNGDEFRFVASADGTIVSYENNGGVETVVLLDRGEFHTFNLRPAQTTPANPLNAVRAITSNLPIQLMQYSHGQDNGGVESDPFMILIPPTEQFLYQYTVSTPASGFANNFINVVVPTSAVGSLMLDGSLVNDLNPPPPFEEIGDSGYSGAILPVGIGSHHLTAALPFGVYSYGYDNHDSYGYPGGLRISPGVKHGLTLTPATDELHVGNSAGVTARLLNEFGAPLADSTVSFSVAGSNTASGTAVIDQYGNATFNYVGINTGLDTITATAGSLQATATKTWIGGAPQIDISSPDDGDVFAVGSQVLIFGHALQSAPNAPIAGVYVGGVPVDALDAAGTFFHHVTIQPGLNPFSFTAIDVYGAEATTQVTLEGIQQPTRGFDTARLTDVSTIGAHYGRTSFDDRTETLYAELQIENTGTYSINGPLLVGVKNISSPLVTPADIDGYTAAGIPYYDFTAAIDFFDIDPDGRLAPGDLSGFQSIAFLNPKRKDFTYDLVLLAELNQPPQFTTAPVVEASADAPYEYPFDAVDANGDPIEYFLNSDPQGFLLDAINQRIIWTPTNADVGIHAVSLGVRDDQGGQTIQSFQLSVAEASANRAPAFVSVPVTTVAFEQTYIYSALARDVDGDSVTYSIVGPSGMAIEPSGPDAGRITWEPSLSQVGSHPVTITADDGMGATNTAEQQFTITVSPAEGNSAPTIISPPVQSVLDSGSYRYPVVAVDPDDDLLEYSLVPTTPAGMSIGLFSGLIDWEPTETGIFPVTVDVIDRKGHMTSQTFNVNVIDTSPVQLSGIVFNDTNRDGILAGDPGLAGWTVYVDTNNNRKFDSGEPSRTTNASGYYLFDDLPSGKHSLRRVLEPGWVPSNIHSISHLVDPDAGDVIDHLDFATHNRDADNKPPQFDSQPPLNAIYGQPLRYDIIATDPDGDPIKYSLSYGPSGMAIDEDSGVVTWTPLVWPNNDYSVTLRVEDDHGGFALQPFRIRLHDAANDPPEITSQPRGEVKAGSPWRYQLIATDPNGDPLSYRLDPASINRSMSITNDGLVNWTPTTTGRFRSQVTVDDGRGGTATQVITIDVGGNTPPRFDTVDPYFAIVDQPLSLSFTFLDDDGDVVTPSLDSNSIARGMTLDFTPGASVAAIQWTPETIGTYQSTVTLTDANNAVATRTWTIPVNPSDQTNRRPEFSSTPTGPASRNAPWQYPALATDPDGDQIYWSLDTTDLAQQLSQISPLSPLPQISSAGLITWTAPTAGNFSFSVIAADRPPNDPNRLESGQRLTLPVTANASPRFDSDPIRTVDANTAYTYFAHALDPNDDPLQYSLDSDAPGIEIVSSGIDARKITWDANETTTPGIYPITVTVTDGNSGSDVQTYSLHVVDPNAPNQHPVIASTLSAKVKIGARLIHDINATDPDFDPLTFGFDSGLLAGMSIDSYGVIDWTPTADQLGEQTFVVFADDGRGGRTTKPLHVTVTNSDQNSRPRFTTQPTVNAVNGRLYRYDADAADPDGDNLTYALSNQPTGMTVDQTTGLVQWVPGATQLGAHDVTLTVSDGRGGLDTRSFTINVAPFNRPPIIDSHPSQFGLLDQPYSYAIKAHDPDGDKLHFSLDPAGTSPDLDGPNAPHIDPETGLLVWTPQSTDVAQFQINVTDEFGAGVGQTFTVTVSDQPRNARPYFAGDPPLLSIARQQTYTYAFEAFDPDGDPLTFELADKPSGASLISDANAPAGFIVQWHVPHDQPLGEPVNFRLVVTDVPSNGAPPKSGWYEFSVGVQFGNVAPVWTMIGDQQVTEGQTFYYDAHAYDANAGDVLTYSIEQIKQNDIILDPNSPGYPAISIDPQHGRLQWATTAGDASGDVYEITVGVTDGRVASPVTQLFDLSVVTDASPPTVTLIATPSVVNYGEWFDIQVYARDNVGVASRSLMFEDQPLPLSASGFYRFYTTIDDLGSLTFIATATDAAGNQSAVASIDVPVSDPTDTNAPTVDLLPPGGPVHIPTKLFGIVTDNEPDVAWTLSISPVSPQLGRWTRIITPNGSGNVVAGQTVGTFDPSGLANGSYRVTLTADDVGSSGPVSDSIIIDVDSDFKLGNFSLSFTDLEIPVAGIPITVTRTYDTLDANVSGDFGYGWNIDIAMPSASLDMGSIGEVSFSGYPAFINGTRVNVVTPEGDVEGFSFEWIQLSDGLAGAGLTDSWGPSFNADGGNRYQLVPPNRGFDFERVSENGFQDDDGILYSALDPKFGNAFELTEVAPGSRGLSYLIPVATMRGTQVSDKYGNSLDIHPDGIVSNSGRQIEIERDWRNRITKITDPLNQTLEYEYDNDGRLIAFYDRRATERRLDNVDGIDVEGNDFQPTRFEYDPVFVNESGAPVAGPDGSENFLTRIIDPLGVTALQTDYDHQTGRLRGLKDADGNDSSLNYEFDTDLQTAIANRSTPTSSPISSSFDRFGRLISETDAAGQRTVYTYIDDTIRYPYQTIQVIGMPDGPAAWADRSGDDLVTTRQYDAEFVGAVWNEVDPAGNATVTTYSRWSYNKGYPIQVSQSDGSEIEYHWFDSFGVGKLELTAQTDQNGERFARVRSCVRFSTEQTDGQSSFHPDVVASRRNTRARFHRRQPSSKE
jgi:YD repeat-containing protein